MIAFFTSIDEGFSMAMWVITRWFICGFWSDLPEIHRCFFLAGRRGASAQWGPGHQRWQLRDARASSMWDLSGFFIWFYPCFTNTYDWLVVWNMAVMTFHILGISSSQLTSSYFSEGLKPPTRWHGIWMALNHIGFNKARLGINSLAYQIAFPEWFCWHGKVHHWTWE